MNYNFTVFTDHVINGTKPHTIRRISKRRPPRVGEMLQLYTGSRTPACHKLIDDLPCLGAQPIQIRTYWADDTLHGTITLAGVTLSPRQMARLIWNDGFRVGPKVDLKGFHDFFVIPGMDVVEVDGVLISWRPHSLLGIGALAGVGTGDWCRMSTRPPCWPHRVQRSRHSRACRMTHIRLTSDSMFPPHRTGCWPR